MKAYFTCFMTSLDNKELKGEFFYEDIPNIYKYLHESTKNIEKEEHLAKAYAAILRSYTEDSFLQRTVNSMLREKEKEYGQKQIRYFISYFLLIYGAFLYDYKNRNKQLGKDCL